MVACNAGADVDNIVCVGKSETDLCPINDVEVKAKAEVPDWDQQELESNWINLELDSQYLLRYSKEGN